jgi:multiple sugar transport system permease protein
VERWTFGGLTGKLAMISEGRFWAYLLLLPSLILVLAVVIYPVGSGILLSFREMRLTRPDLGTPFVGLQHYADILRDPIVRVAARNSVIWIVVGSLSQFLLGLVTALALNQPIPGFRIARILVLLPWFMPSVVAGHMWALLLDSRLGVINDLLVRVGILDSYHAWFADPSTALPAVLVAELWRHFPFFTLLILAGLQAIPQDLYDAAAMDGAGYWHRFRDVTMPLLMPVIVAATILRVIGLVNSPDLLVVLTGGGPGRATETVSLYAFQAAYLKFDFGYAAALSVVLLLVLIVFTAVYVRASGVTKE